MMGANGYANARAVSLKFWIHPKFHSNGLGNASLFRVGRRPRSSFREIKSNILSLCDRLLGSAGNTAPSWGHVSVCLLQTDDRRRAAAGCGWRVCAIFQSPMAGNKLDAINKDHVRRAESNSGHARLRWPKRVVCESQSK